MTDDSPADTAPPEGSAEVAGEFLLGLVGSFYNLRVLPQGGLKLRIEEIEPRQWYPYSLLLETIRDIERVLPAETSKSLFFRAGIHFLTIWYEQGPGKEMIHSGIDWFYSQTRSGGYNTVVRGKLKDVGWTEMLSMDNRVVASALMRRWGMLVTETADGPAALAQIGAVSRLDDAGYDIVVLDGLMPGMDGWQLAAAIRQIPGCATLPLVMASSAGLKPDPLSSESNPFRRFLIKPLRPAQLATALAEALADWQPRQTTPIPQPTRSARVLLVEDTKVNQMVARAMLEKGGHQVTLATNGVEALALLEQPGLFDLILMDCQMPEMDGFEATRRLRQREREHGWKTHRVVAMTANAMQGDKEACLAAGMDGYLAKPVQMGQLLKTAQEGLEMRNEK